MKMRTTDSDNHSAGHNPEPGSWIPPWVGLLDMPVWITDPWGTMQYMNKDAEGLLGKRAEACVGEPCHAIVCGTKPSGPGICGPECAVRRAVASKEKIAPIEMCLPREDGEDQHAKIVVIAASSPDEYSQLLVHCAVDEHREHRVKEYLATIVGRNHVLPDIKKASKPTTNLTKREREILRLLAEDETLHSIADKLYISYATVRNHVQHILPKLGVHSILEAVAFYLLSEKE